MTGRRAFLTGLGAAAMLAVARPAGAAKPTITVHRDPT